MGQSVMGEPLVAWGNGMLQVMLNERKPAYTLLNFNY
jgi:uncharacterized protein YmfQ (DUF2313 family)